MNEDCEHIIGIGGGQEGMDVFDVGEEDDMMGLDSVWYRITRFNFCPLCGKDLRK